MRDAVFTNARRLRHRALEFRGLARAVPNPRGTPAERLRGSPEA